MTRTVQDANLEIWEAYASAGKSGFPQQASIVFYCLSDRKRRARAVQRDAEKAEVEQQIGELSDDELRGLLEEASEVK